MAEYVAPTDPTISIRGGDTTYTAVTFTVTNWGNPSQGKVNYAIYNSYAPPVSEWEWAPASFTTSRQIMVYPATLPASKYNISARAWNGQLYSNTKASGTFYTPAPRPKNVQVLNLTKTSCDITFSIPKHGGAFELAYWITGLSEDAKGDIPHGASSHTVHISGLTPNRSYSLKVYLRSVTGFYASDYVFVSVKTPPIETFYCSVNNTAKRAKKIYCGIDGYAFTITRDPHYDDPPLISYIDLDYLNVHVWEVFGLQPGEISFTDFAISWDPDTEYGTIIGYYDGVSRQSVVLEYNEVWEWFDACDRMGLFIDYVFAIAPWQAEDDFGVRLDAVQQAKSVVKIYGSVGGAAKCIYRGPV